MKRLGYHYLETADGQIIHGPLVVELSDEDKFLSWHLLQNEEPRTIWVGGTYKSIDLF